LKSAAEDFFTIHAGRRLVLSAAGAAARGAYEAGAGLVLTYPGSPVVETFDLLASPESPLKSRCRIIINEHVAYHQALGYSLAGGRSFLIMKHVGVNVASDPMHYSAYTGVNGGMVILVGSDPGANCSTGEFDVRFYSLHTHIPILEPRDFGETVAATRNAFEISERYKLPVMVVIPSAFCYGVGSAQSGEAAPVKTAPGFVNSPDYTCVGAFAVKRHEALMDKISRLQNVFPDFESEAMKPDFINNGGALIIASGIYRDYAHEALFDLGLSRAHSIYSPLATYPLNHASLLKAFTAAEYKKVVVIEDLEGFLETQLCGFMTQNKITAEIFGKNYFKCAGELKYPEVKNILKRLLEDGAPLCCEGAPSVSISRSEGFLEPVMREGTFCPGCPHRAFFYALNKYISPEDVLGGDIGCSSLPPHFSSWLTCMNSGTSIASGVALADGRGGGAKKQKVVSLIGDSTLFHGGLQTIMECAASDSNQICFILDNGWTAMTGHQPTFNTRPFQRQADGAPQALSIKKILESFGVKRIYEADPYRINKFKALLNEIIDSEDGFSAVIVKRECRLQAKKRKDSRNEKPIAEGLEPAETFEIIKGRCAGCNECYSVFTCPAIFKNEEGELYINQDICVKCGVCRQICPNGAICKSESSYGR